MDLKTVHPRWRGEHIWRFDYRYRLVGSSPLARGTQPPRLKRPGVGRFIPAGAGNTARRIKAPRQSPVHPRWRGEHGRFGSPSWPLSGSSPLARGTPLRRVSTLPTARFIPAGAGNTAVERIPAAGVTVHPRWRGEHSWAPQIVPLGVRFIPAGAGNTSRADQGCLFQPVHPRWRGEHR